ncbi:hypothetical protein [Gorillibacterium sp. sgz500922]|uniref:hypothetical protein n=1 Tax=Gorillibacterium sp. sgz500922 TaxID=3446694 RepID=UPI003F668259
MRSSRKLESSTPSKRAKRLAVSVLCLGAAAALSVGVSYADVDLFGKVDAWATSKGQAAVAGLQSSLQTETEKQKAELQQRLSDKLQSEEKALAEFAEQQKAAARQALQAHVDELVAGKTFVTDADRQQIADKLNQIVQSAESAMDRLGDSYAPPVLTYEAPAAAAEPSTVGEAVYGEAGEPRP